MSEIRDLTNRKFGNLIAKKIVGSNKYKYKLWQCVCKCGNKPVVSSICLVQNYTKSCGCKNPLKKTHGMSKSVEYHTWCNIVSRTENSGNDPFERYKRRGIKICKRWRDSFQAFFDDMGKRPSSRHSVDRKDNDAGYTCGKCQECSKNNWTFNCRWADKKTQMSNMLSNHFLIYKGIRLTMAQWCLDSHSKEYRRVRHRKYLGWSDTNALKDIPCAIAIAKDAKMTCPSGS